MREKKDRNGGIKTIQIRKGETIKRLKPEDEGKEKKAIFMCCYARSVHLQFNEPLIASSN